MRDHFCLWSCHLRVLSDVFLIMPVEAANRTGRVTAIFATNVSATEAATLIKR